MNKSIITLAALATLVGAANAQFVEFNFNSVVPDGNTSTGSLDPNIGVGSLALLGGVTSSFSNGAANGGSSDPAGNVDNSGLQTTTYATSVAESGLRGVQFNTSTAQGVGYNNIKVEFDIRSSNTSSRFMKFEYTVDGTNYSSANLANNGVFELLGGDTWVNNIMFDLSSVTAANNNASFAFKIVAVVGPTGGFDASNPTSTYAGSGTKRFDMVQVYGEPVPEPATMAALGLGVAALVRRRRSK